jgi:hypothetical protein
MNWEYYIFTFLFVAGNLFFPWLVHTIPLGGPTFLPIYFFVLIGAYKFGWRVGVLTAILSPLSNHFLTGMPPTNMLTAIFVKGIAMAILASFIAINTKKLSFQNLAIIIIGYQTVGFIFEWIYAAKFTSAMQDFVIGYPGLLIQFFIGYLILWLLRDYGKEHAI